MRLVIYAIARRTTGVVARAGRKPAPELLRKEAIGLKLPRWLIEWTDLQSESRAVLIEQALCHVHKLTPPRRKKKAQRESSI